jgi:nitrogen fixation/metabolism regulation signal transduction histidine kinase
MVYKQNTMFLILRLILILAVMMTIPLLTRIIEEDQLIFTYIVIVLVLGTLVFELVRYTNRSNRELTEFLQHILNRDFNLHFNEDKTKGARKALYQTFNEALQTYKEIKIEKEIQFRFLEHIVELIEVGIIVLDQSEKIVLINSSAEALSGISSPGTWDQVRKKNPEFAGSVDGVKGPQRVLGEFKSREGTRRLVLHVNRTSMLDEPYTLITFQDIESVADDMETGAWVRLMRILNHEIRNSITPITSLAETIMMILQHEDGGHKELAQLNQQNLSDIITSLEALHKRSENLHQFIHDYQQLTKIPAPVPRNIVLKPFIEEILSLFRAEFDRWGIRYSLELEPEDQILRADRNLLQQVLINLIRNSLEALQEEDHLQIVIRSEVKNERLLMVISDNGTGILPGILDEIFVPFYTTKPQGSGIGLSLSRQIMRMHGGNLKVTSEPGAGTNVYLDFQT